MYKSMEEVLSTLKSGDMKIGSINKAIHREIKKHDVERALMFYEAKIRWKIWKDNSEEKTE